MRSDIELLRIISAFGIVWFHSGVLEGKEIAYSGLIFFVIVSVFFSLESKKTPSIKVSSKKLLLPCVTWSLVYYFAYSTIDSSHSLFTDNLFLNILSTPSIHLWYLPFSFVVTLIVTTFKFSITRISSTFILSIILPLIFISSPYWRELVTPNPLPQYLHAIPAIIIGCLFHTLKKGNEKIHCMLISCSLIISIYILFMVNLTGLTITYFLGVIICLPLLLKSSLFVNENINKLSKLTFGIYLVHILPLALFNRIGMDGWLLPTLTFFTSALTIHLLNIFIPIKYRRLFI